MGFDVEKIALEADVRKEIENELNMEIKNVIELRFDYSADRGDARIDVVWQEDGKILVKRIYLNRHDADNLVFRLAEKFNFQCTTTSELFFKLKHGEPPVFTMKFFPWMNDVETVDESKISVTS